MILYLIMILSVWYGSITFSNLIRTSSNTRVHLVFARDEPYDIYSLWTLTRKIIEVFRSVRLYILLDFVNSKILDLQLCSRPRGSIST